MEALEERSMQPNDGDELDDESIKPRIVPVFVKFTDETKQKERVVKLPVNLLRAENKVNAVIQYACKVFPELTKGCVLETTGKGINYEIHSDIEMMEFIQSNKESVTIRAFQSFDMEQSPFDMHMFSQNWGGTLQLPTQSSVLGVDENAQTTAPDTTNESLLGHLTPIFTGSRSKITISSLEDHLSAHKISWSSWKSENNRKTVEDLFEEVRHGVCDLRSDGANLFRVVRLVRVEIRHPETKFVLVNALKIVNHKREITQVNRLPAFKYNQGEEPYHAALRNIQLEIGHDLWGTADGLRSADFGGTDVFHRDSLYSATNNCLPTIMFGRAETAGSEIFGVPPRQLKAKTNIRKVLKPLGFLMPSKEEDDSKSFPGLQTTYLINTLVFELLFEGVPREGSFVTVDQLRPDITRIWQWMKPEYVQEKILKIKNPSEEELTAALGNAMHHLSLMDAPKYAKSKLEKLQFGLASGKLKRNGLHIQLPETKDAAKKFRDGKKHRSLVTPFGSSPLRERAKRQKERHQRLDHPPPTSILTRLTQYWKSHEQDSNIVLEKREKIKTSISALPANKDLITEEFLSRWLNSHGVDTSKWGTGQSKHLWQLLDEIHNRETELVIRERPIDPSNQPQSSRFGLRRTRSSLYARNMMRATRKQVVRIIRVAKVDILHPGSTDLILVESHQKLADGRLRVRHKTLSEKFKPHETPWEAALRGITEELFEPDVYTVNDLGQRIVHRRRPIQELQDKVSIINLSSPEVEISNSPSYPGLETQYFLHKFSCMVEELPFDKFRTDEPSKKGGYVTHFWDWESRDQARYINESLWMQVRVYHNLVPPQQRDAEVLQEWLFEAAEKNRVDVIKLLCGVNETLLETLQDFDDFETSDELAELSFDKEHLDPSSLLNQDMCTPLRVAALHSSEEAVDVLIRIQIIKAKYKLASEVNQAKQNQDTSIDEGNDVYDILNQPDNKGCTLLYYAAIANRTDLVRGLLSSKKTAVNSVCLHSCISRGAVDVLPLLLRRLRYEKDSADPRLLFGVDIDSATNVDDRSYMVSTPSADDFDYFLSLLIHADREISKRAGSERLIIKVPLPPKVGEDTGTAFSISIPSQLNIAMNPSKSGTTQTLSPRVLATLKSISEKAKTFQRSSALASQNPTLVSRKRLSTTTTTTSGDVSSQIWATGDGGPDSSASQSGLITDEAEIIMSTPLRALEIILQFCNPTAHYYKDYLRLYLQKVIEMDKESDEKKVFFEFLMKSRFPLHIALMSAQVLRSTDGVEKRFWDSYQVHADYFQEVVCGILDCCEDQSEAEELLRERADIPFWRKGDGSVVVRPFAHRHKSTCSYLAIKYKLKKVVAHKFFTTQNDSIWFNDENDSLYTKWLGSIQNLTAGRTEYHQAGWASNVVSKLYKAPPGGHQVHAGTIGASSSHRADMHRKTRSEGILAFLLRVPGLKPTVQGMYRLGISLVLLVLLVLFSPILWFVPFSYPLRVLVDLPRSEFSCCYFKWSVWSISYVAYLFLFGYVATTNVMRDHSTSDFLTKEEIALMLFLLANCVGFAEQIVTIGWGPFFQHPVNMIDSMSSFFVTIAYFSRLMLGRDARVFDICMSFAALLASLRLFHLFSASKDLGPLWITMEYVIWDVVCFLTLLGVVLISFIMAFVFLSGGQPVAGFENAGRAFSSLLWSVFNPLSPDDPSQTDLFQVLLFFFLLVAAVLLPNLLIALMTKRFESVQQTARVEWLFSLAQLIDKYSSMGILPPPFNLLTVLPNLVFFTIYGSQSLYDPDSFQPNARTSLLLFLNKVVTFRFARGLRRASVVPGTTSQSPRGSHAMPGSTPPLPRSDALKATRRAPSLSSMTQSEVNRDEMQALTFRSTRRAVASRYVERCRSEERKALEVRSRLDEIARLVDKCNRLLLVRPPQLPGSSPVN